MGAVGLVKEKINKIIMMNDVYKPKASEFIFIHVYEWQVVNKFFDCKQDWAHS